MTKQVEEFAAAKVNLDLLVTGRRADGCHLLDSLVVFTEFGDRITVSAADDLHLELSGPYSPAVPANAGNLVLKAAKLLQDTQAVKRGAKIYLEKNIPLAAGLGGGSADAAATLKALTRLWALSLSPETLAERGLSLGADIPVCLLSQAAIMRGIGEKIQKTGMLPQLSLLLVNPGLCLSTAQVFKAGPVSFSDPVDRSALLGATDQDDVISLCRDQRNDLTEVALRLAPVIDQVLQTIRKQKGCRLARMSGSGATCFGLFADLEAAHMAKKAVLRDHADWWAVASLSKP